LAMSEDQMTPNHEGTTRVVQANQKVHGQLAHAYNESEPHFRPENQAKVHQRLTELATRAPSNDRMLDLGCGTGFLLQIARDLFKKIDGIDATQAMLDRVDLSPGNITLHQGIVEALPFEDATFDIVTAYSFLDHLEDHVPVLHEAARVLRQGGIIYIDLVPNRAFWSAIYSSSQSSDRPHDAIVEREIDELVNHEEKLQSQFGIDPLDWRDAEPAKSGSKGFAADELKADLGAAGFDSEVRFEWYLGEAVVMHGQSIEEAQTVDAHLRRLRPVSDPLFKYLVVTGVKR
jgi:ubiquinone/menaquinone biosynthesis C-methylase UbiE